MSSIYKKCTEDCLENNLSQLTIILYLTTDLYRKRIPSKPGDLYERTENVKLHSLNEEKKNRFHLFIIAMISKEPSWGL